MCWKPYCILLLLSLSPLSTSAVLLERPCAELLAPIAPSGKGSSYLVGLLAETRRGQIVLGFTKIIGPGHEGMVELISEEFGAIAKVYWAGEVKFKDGKIISANNTSGTLHDSQLVVEQNQFQSLRTKLEELAPNILDPSAKFYTHKHDFEYLDQKFEKLKRYRQRFGQGMPFRLRHDLAGAVQNAIMNLNTLRASARGTYELDEVSLRAIRKDFRLAAMIGDYAGIEKPEIRAKMATYRLFDKAMATSKAPWRDYLKHFDKYEKALGMLRDYILQQTDYHHPEAIYLYQLK